MGRRVDGELVAMDEAMEFPDGDVPAESAVRNRVGDIPPWESVLGVVVVVEGAEEGAGLLFGEHGPRFIGGAVDVVGGPHERDPVGPVTGEQSFGLGDAS